jgi:DNA-binding GntR family transcriptional regulator
MSEINRRLSSPLRARVSTSEAVTSELRKAIVQGRLEPGEPLRQETLARHFKVSHIPIREALRQLESEGWVSIEPNKGASVSALDANEALEIYEMRAALECLALRVAMAWHDAATLRFARDRLLAASRESDPSLYVRRNEEFHAALLAPAPRPHLLAAIRQLHRRSERYLRLKYRQPVLKHASDAEHQALFEACEQRNVRRACAVLTRHLTSTGELLARHLDELRVEHVATEAIGKVPRSRG